MALQRINPESMIDVVGFSGAEMINGFGLFPKLNENQFLVANIYNKKGKEYLLSILCENNIDVSQVIYVASTRPDVRIGFVTSPILETCSNRSNIIDMSDIIPR